MDNTQERIDLVCAFRAAVKYNLHEAVANHFSLAVSTDGSRFLINPNQRHFRISAPVICCWTPNDPAAMHGEDAPDATAWGLHGSLHRRCSHARCVMHVHSTYATVLALLADSCLPPIDLNTAMFYNHLCH